jgi:hypothetical protein
MCSDFSETQVAKLEFPSYQTLRLYSTPNIIWHRVVCGYLNDSDSDP